MTMTTEEAADKWRQAVEACKRYGDLLRRVKATLGSNAYPAAFDD